MTNSIHVTHEPVILSGYQAVLKSTKFGYQLKAVVNKELIEKLEAERKDLLKSAISKIKKPERSILRPCPWEETENDNYFIKFSWDENTKPIIVDTDCKSIKNLNTPIFDNARVKIAFNQRAYLLRDGITYGTSLKLVGVQVVAIGSSLEYFDEQSIEALFGKTEGFKATEPIGIAKE